jgi:hypothetical protein
MQTCPTAQSSAGCEAYEKRSQFCSKPNSGVPLGGGQTVVPLIVLHCGLQVRLPVVFTEHFS